jgi:hypothetical protein
MMIDGITAKNFFLRVLFSVGITAAIGGSSYFCIRWLSGADHGAVPPLVETGLKAKK